MPPFYSVAQVGTEGNREAISSALGVSVTNLGTQVEALLGYPQSLVFLRHWDSNSQCLNKPGGRAERGIRPAR